MVRVKVKQIEDINIDGLLCCKERYTAETIKIYLPDLQEDGVLIYHDGKIDIGGSEPSIEYFTDNPPHTDEVCINITGWFDIFYTLVIEPHKEYTYIAVIDNPKDHVLTHSQCFCG